MSKPLLAITMGDPAGVGPEVIAGAWRDPRVHEMCRPLVLGHPVVMRRAAGLVDDALMVHEILSPDEAHPCPTALPCLSCVSENVLAIPPGQIDARAGQAAFDAVTAAVDLALAGRVDGIVTAPLSKAALWQSGHRYPGHTELLAERCGVDDFAMMLYLAQGNAIAGRAGLGVIHVTLHTALRGVFEQLTQRAIVSKIQLASDVFVPLLSAAGVAEKPHIGVCALNPHAGEEGLFGDEEQRTIAPAVDEARGQGFCVEGPISTDTLMVRAAAGEFDAVVAMYHDQGHIALKLLGMHRAVNVTLGLPIVRTSVAHGTAFDLAWQGRAETGSMVEAIRVAAQLVGSTAVVRAMAAGSQRQTIPHNL